MHRAGACRRKTANRIIMSQIRIATAALGLALLGGTAIAQAAPPHRTRGTIDSITATQLVVTSRSGAQVTYAISGDTKVAGEKTVPISAIQTGSYIGSAAVPAGDGKLRALEVTVFPPAMKGVGEGHYGWDLGASSSMTNGTVGHLVVSNGNTMTVDYAGGKKTIIVPADVPIVTIDPGAMSDLKPGAKVIVFPSKNDAKTAGTILYGENGIVPPQ
jgi:hypothetical protein